MARVDGRGSMFLRGERPGGRKAGGRSAGGPGGRRAGGSEGRRAGEGTESTEIDDGVGRQLRERELRRAAGGDLIRQRETASIEHVGFAAAIRAAHADAQAGDVAVAVVQQL